MAQLKDTVVSGSLRATDSLLTTTLQTQILKLPTASNGTTYGPGTNGHIIFSNGNSVYWGATTGITALGTVTTGTWNATKINPNKGGTGIDSYAKGDILYAGAAIANTATTALSKLALGTAGYTLQATANGPAWAQTVAVANGGTGKTSWTQWGVLYASASTTLANTGAGTAGYLLQSNASSAPSWIQATNANTASTIVKRDASGNFSAGTITASLNGNADTATKLAHTTLNSTTINNTAGSFAFSGSGDPFSGEDWVGLQIGDSVDKWQVLAGGNTLRFRQNDNGGTNTTWSDWVTMLTSGNYTTYTVKKDGTGASGTWVINITGTVNSWTFGVPTSLNADDVRTSNGLWAVNASITNAASTNHSLLLGVSHVGTPFQIQIPDSSVMYIYKRYYSNSAWSAWSKISAGYADSAGSCSGNAATATCATRTGVSVSWHKGRDAVVAKTTTINSYSPTISVKTTNGSWEIGSYNHNDYTDKLIFSYVTDANYNSNTNSHVDFTITTGGYFSGSCAKANGLTDGSNTMTSAYNKAAMAYADYTWLAGWNGYELRAVAKTQFAQASHTHSYLPLSGGTLTGALNVKPTSGRSNINMVSVADEPTDLYFGSNNANKWSLSCRKSSESYYLGLYSTVDSAWRWVWKHGGQTISYGTLAIINNSQNDTTYNALLYIEHKSGNDWGILVNKNEAYDYGIRVQCLSTGTSGISCIGRITGTKVYGAVWNDYAEYRKGEITDGGYCVHECPDGTMRKSTERLEAGCRVTSDTFGFAIGETEKSKTPIAVSGRVLVYPYRDKKEYKLGDAVCSAPDGKVDIMSRNEIIMYPERIIGTVSEIPNYDIWECGEGKDDKLNHRPVNGRIWIYVK